MEILSFDLEGKFAHFRKFHGNNTAMTYSIPPRTTIIGILAAMVGEAKDSYYESYRDPDLKVGVRVMSNLKKSFHRLNFLKITGSGDFGGSKGRIQTPFEIVTGHDLKKDSVKYRIYLTPGNSDTAYQKIKLRLNESKPQYNLSLGIASFSAYVGNVVVRNCEERTSNNDWLVLHSACNSEQVSEINFPDTGDFQFNHIEEELLPADFIGGEKGREVYRMNRVLFTTQDFPIHVKLAGNYCELPDSEGIENIQFLDYAGIFSQ